MLCSKCENVVKMNIFLYILFVYSVFIIFPKEILTRVSCFKVLYYCEAIKVCTIRCNNNNNDMLI